MPPRSIFLGLLAFALAAAAPPAPVAPDFRAMCPYDAQLCADYDAFKARLDATPRADAEALGDLNAGFIALVRRTDANTYDHIGRWPLGPREIQGSIYGGLAVLRRSLNALSTPAARRESDDIAARLLEEEQRADALMSGLQNPHADPASDAAALSALDADASATWEKIRTLAFDVDRMGDPIDSSKERRLTTAGEIVGAEINPLQVRIAGLRDRLRAIRSILTRGGLPDERSAARDQSARGRQDGASSRLRASGLLADPFGARAAAAAPGGAPPAAPSNHPPFDLTASPSRLLDAFSPPSLPAAVQRPTSLILGKTNTDDDSSETTSENSTPFENARISTLRRLHLTATVGDPVGRARFSFPQTGGTCALASQAEMYAEIHGIEPTPANMRRLEDEFFARASKNNLFTGNSADPGQRGTRLFGAGGTPDEYLGDMLDTPVKKHYLASVSDLNAVVKSGKMILASVNAGMLWNIRKFRTGGHAIVITGAETNRVTGAVLGYYINDTGSNEAARFVSASQFIPAWNNRGSVFVEAL